jgi:hypothetical protein
MVLNLIPIVSILFTCRSGNLGLCKYPDTQLPLRSARLSGRLISRASAMSTLRKRLPAAPVVKAATRSTWSSRTPRRTCKLREIHLESSESDVMFQSCVMSGSGKTEAAAWIHVNERRRGAKWRSVDEQRRSGKNSNDANDICVYNHTGKTPDSHTSSYESSPPPREAYQTDPVSRIPLLLTRSVVLNGLTVKVLLEHGEESLVRLGISPSYMTLPMRGLDTDLSSFLPAEQDLGSVAHRRQVA